jgi:antitoxin MazE
MESHIQKWGNSFGVRLPMRWVKQHKLHKGSPISVDIDADRIVIQPPKYTLEELLEQIPTKKSKKPRKLLLEDHPRGDEAW